MLMAVVSEMLLIMTRMSKERSMDDMLQGCVGVIVAAGDVVAATGAGVPVVAGAEVLEVTGAKVVLAGAAVVGSDGTVGVSD